jgi:integrase
MAGKQAKTLALYCFTGLRRGDAARLGRQHIRNGVIEIDTEKTGTQVTIPVLPELAEIIAAGPIGELSIIASKKGQPIRKEVLGNLFKKACKARPSNITARAASTGAHTGKGRSRSSYSSSELSRRSRECNVRMFAHARKLLGLQFGFRMA